YNAQHADILAKLGRLRTLLHDPAHWWNRDAAQAATVEACQIFVANATRNFGENSPCYARINAPESWEKWRSGLLAAIVGYPADSAAWRAMLA
ncbi:MAG: hypothetical protein Q8N07_07590, partial [Rhodocyclaceae bacterium]|nr:hypothetical protein [Rhodocyclaceae bacterium]